MASLTPDLGLEIDPASIQAQVSAVWADLPAYNPSVPDLTATLAGVPLWVFAPGLLLIVVLVSGLSALPWRSSDYAPVVREVRHSNFAFCVVATGLLLSIGMAQGFIMAANTIGVVTATR